MYGNGIKIVYDYFEYYYLKNDGNLVISDDCVCTEYTQRIANHFYGIINVRHPEIKGSVKPYLFDDVYGLKNVNIKFWYLLK